MLTDAAFISAPENTHDKLYTQWLASAKEHYLETITIIDDNRRYIKTISNDTIQKVIHDVDKALCRMLERDYRQAVHIWSNQGQTRHLMERFLHKFHADRDTI